MGNHGWSERLREKRHSPHSSYIPDGLSVGPAESDLCMSASIVDLSSDRISSSDLSTGAFSLRDRFAEDSRSSRAFRIPFRASLIGQILARTSSVTYRHRCNI